jgi:hypothetical protein
MPFLTATAVLPFLPGKIKVIIRHITWHGVLDMSLRAEPHPYASLAVVY